MAGRPSDAFIQRQRERKAVELEADCVAEGVTAGDLVDEAARDRVLVAYAKRMGKRRSQVHASIETWRVVWRLLHDRETRGQGTDANPFVGNGAR